MAFFLKFRQKTTLFLFIQVSRFDHKLQHHSEIKKLHFQSRIDLAHPKDYFIVRKNMFPWEDVPEFVVGRPGFDTWLVRTVPIRHVLISISQIPSCHNVLVPLESGHCQDGQSLDALKLLPKRRYM